MPAPNPYAPPGAPPARPPEPSSYEGAHSADLFADTLPTTQARGAGIASILTGVATIFVAIQLVIGVVHPRTIVLVMEAVLAAIGGGHFVVAWAISAARGWSTPLGVALSALGALLVATVFFLSGALSCVMAGVTSLVALVLVAVSHADVQRMARARAAMLRS